MAGATMDSVAEIYAAGVAATVNAHARGFLDAADGAVVAAVVSVVVEFSDAGAVC